MINALSKLTGRTINDASEVLIQGFTGSVNSSTTGALIKVDSVFSISEGKVIEVGTDEENLTCVTIQYTPTDLFRYCRLKSVDVDVNDYIIPTTKIGEAFRSQLRFEYCTLDESQYPVRISDTTYYKHDPNGYLLGGKQLYMSLYAAGQLLDKANSDVKQSATSSNKPLTNLTNILPGVK